MIKIGNDYFINRDLISWIKLVQDDKGAVIEIRYELGGKVYSTPWNSSILAKMLF